MEPFTDVLLITGSMGAGKTTILNEATDILAARNVVHAAIDLDMLGIVHLPGGAPHELVFRNLASMCAHCTAAGVSRFLIAAAVETAGELQRIREAMFARRLFTCRLTAPVAVMEQRVASRERGMAAARYVARVAELEELLDRVHLEEVSILNDRESITSVAHRVLSAAGWT